MNENDEPVFPLRTGTTKMYYSQETIDDLRTQLAETQRERDDALTHMRDANRGAQVNAMVNRALADKQNILIAQLAEAQRERDAEKWKLEELRKAIAELEGCDEQWPNHGNVTLGIAAGYALQIHGREKAEAERDAALARVERLETALTAAPHGRGCGLYYSKDSPAWMKPGVCDCWKREALEGK